MAVQTSCWEWGRMLDKQNLQFVLGFPRSALLSGRQWFKTPVQKVISSPHQAAKMVSESSLQGSCDQWIPLSTSLGAGTRSLSPHHPTPGRQNAKTPSLQKTKSLLDEGWDLVLLSFLRFSRNFLDSNRCFCYIITSQICCMIVVCICEVRKKWKKRLLGISNTSLASCGFFNLSSFSFVETCSMPSLSHTPHNVAILLTNRMHPSLRKHFLAGRMHVRGLVSRSKERSFLFLSKSSGTWPSTMMCRGSTMRSRGNQQTGGEATCHDAKGFWIHERLQRWRRLFSWSLSNKPCESRPKVETHWFRTPQLRSFDNQAISSSCGSKDVKPWGPHCLFMFPFTIGMF